MPEFDADSCRRIAGAVRFIETAARGSEPPASGDRRVLVSRHFYSTGVITPASSTGTTVSGAVLTQGFGNARICVRDASTHSLRPDASAADQRVYNDVEVPIVAGRFLKCDYVDGQWVIDLKNKCG